MTIQDQMPLAEINDENLAFFKAIGVDYLTVNLPPEISDGQDRAETWRGIRDLAAKHGLKFHNVGTNMWNNISLARPDRDERIAAWCLMLRQLAEAGVETVGYNFKPVGNFRTSSVPLGRGGARYSTFDYEELMQKPPDHPDKQISEEQIWANLEYFLKRAIPVAEEVGIRMALHPDDPPIPEPIGGAARIVSTLDQYERIFGLYPSDSNAMLFCQGCVTEMGIDPYEAIRRIGRQKKIVYVHFRNIRGTPKKFQEVFIDEGQVDMIRAMETYKEVGFNGPFMMDHTPGIPHPAGKWAGHAFVNGYIRALIQKVYG
jgi:mannonate dehydratase